MYYVGSFCKDLLKLALNYKRKGNHGGGREINALIVFRENIVKKKKNSSVFKTFVKGGDVYSLVKV